MLQFKHIFNVEPSGGCDDAIPFQKIKAEQLWLVNSSRKKEKGDEFTIIAMWG